MNGSEKGMLDPRDPKAFREACHKALDVALDHVLSACERPVWTAVPHEVRAVLAEPAPRAGAGLERTVEELTRLILPYPTGNTHPRFFGWVHGTGTASAVVPALFAAAMNVNCGGRDHAGTYVERAVLDWSKELLGFPRNAGGILVTGTSQANLLALAAAREKAEGDQLVAYLSTEGHSSIAKALRLLGIRNEAIRRIPCDADFRMDLAALEAGIRQDRRRGLRPFCVIGSAGTVNTGAFDDLDAIATIASTEGLWFHVDGALGAWCALAPGLLEKVRGMEKADSLAFDFHKWLHVEYACGCVLFRDAALQRRAFQSEADYLAMEGRGLFGGHPWFHSLGSDLSRGFQALKVWFALKEHGADAFRDAIARNCAQARALAALVAAQLEFELLQEPPLNIVCFRYRGSDAANQRIAERLHEEGIAALSLARLHGRTWLRACITNHRTREEDLDILVRALLSAAAE